MRLLYADTSALIGAYLADEPDHAELAAQLLDGATPVVSSELARVEFASAVTAAVRAGRLSDAKPILDRFDADCGEGPISLLALRPEVIMPTARRLVRRRAVRTLDAIHLAVALEDAVALVSGDITFVSRDARQTAAARAVALEVA